MKNKKSFTSLVLIGALVVLIAVGGYFLWSKKARVPVPVAQSVTSQTNTSVSSVSTSLTLDMLKNASYYDGNEKLLKLTDGIYRTPTGCDTDSENCPYTELADNNGTYYAFGDLDGDGQDDAVVVLGSRSGGTGYFEQLAVFLNQNGKPENVHLVVDKDSNGGYLGDRTTVNSLVIKGGLISINMTPWNSANGVAETVNYKLEGNKLVVVK